MCDNLRQTGPGERASVSAGLVPAPTVGTWVGATVGHLAQCRCGAAEPHRGPGAERPVPWCARSIRGLRKRQRLPPPRDVRSRPGPRTAPSKSANETERCSAAGTATRSLNVSFPPPQVPQQDLHLQRRHPGHRVRRPRRALLRVPVRESSHQIDSFPVGFPSRKRAPLGGNGSKSDLAPWWPFAPRPPPPFLLLPLPVSLLYTPSLPPLDRRLGYERRWGLRWPAGAVTRRCAAA